VETNRRRLVERADEFADRAHRSINQKRKYTGEPYIVHPRRVAAMVAVVIDDPEVVAAALLHDVVEDTPVTLTDIEREFGPRVAGFVDDLTDVSTHRDGNRERRKAKDREHTRCARPESKTVKLADLIDNARSITEHDPDFALVYLREKELLLKVLREGHPLLYQMACEVLEECLEVLKGTLP